MKQPTKTTFNKDESSLIDLFGRPSLIPGVEYPISEREEKLLDHAWGHAFLLSGYLQSKDRTEQTLEHLQSQLERLEERLK